MAPRCPSLSLHTGSWVASAAPLARYPCLPEELLKVVGAGLALPVPVEYGGGLVIREVLPPVVRRLDQHVEVVPY